MAIQESNREDLLRDATALVERVAVAPADGGGRIVIGFRSDGTASVYFGDDPAYHFNSNGELRRAYRGGLLFKAEQGKLVSLERIRQASEVQLVRHPLSEAEQASFLAEARERLGLLAGDCKQQKLIVVGQVPADADVLGRALRWLSQCGTIEVVKLPHAR